MNWTHRPECPNPDVDHEQCPDPYYGMGSKEAYENALQGWAEFMNEERDERRVREIVDLPDISTYGKTYAAALVGEFLSYVEDEMLGDMDSWYPTGILNQVVTERDRELAELNQTLVDALGRNGFRVTWEGWVTDH